MISMASSRNEKMQLEVQIFDVNKELQELLKTAEQQKQRATAHVGGFHFPLSSMVEIERLEEAVRKDFDVRKQYVRYLSLKKPPTMNVTNFFSYLFTDDALMGYNYSGTNNIGDSKMPMRNYEIFIDCMIEAWADHGLTHILLEEKIKLVVRKLTA
ncbi:uncharacterized protein LOC109403919 [Aedes albopictus]|uniref:DUF4806 domain-containing protein n=1 Tax=Aedes albopictus TaxID=7160 RepID=A0ABM1YC51_AEDAL|nr:uncharacterized protein LOC109403919 [Aedes albopictus]